ncbi:hypothetical protein AA106555_0566 [Neokomagataea thailandica NBRC 106555]|uniref:Transposase n=1 Tax=Neokomagataea thailandica NBRC 106555 TaxID=1223520 RepID=A0ABQ0QNG9_9PROT|nr:hypothetical protein AA106555_0566 [Neokomagataea thailandica NBRC 106555]
MRDPIAGNVDEPATPHTTQGSAPGLEWLMVSRPSDPIRGKTYRRNKTTCHAA